MQAKSAPTQLISQQAFQNQHETALYWLGSAGVLLNSHGTNILIDPVLEQIELDGQYYSNPNGLKMFQPIPIAPEDVQKIDAILYTHADADHIGETTYQHLLHTKALMHCTYFVKQFLLSQGVPEERIIAHEKLEKFRINDIEVEMTLADHPWHQSKPELYDFYYSIDDCTGFKVKTRDGVIWHPGDSVLLKEHIAEEPVDVLLIDFSDDPYHFGLNGAIQLANKQQNATLIPIHWGTYESDKPALNANPFEASTYLEQPEHLHVLAIGEKFVL